MMGPRISSPSRVNVVFDCSAVSDSAKELELHLELPPAGAMNAEVQLRTDVKIIKENSNSFRMVD